MTKHYVFDAFGTLLDIHSAVHRHSEAVGADFQAFSDLWRSKQLEYAWVRTLMGGSYADFWQLTQQALDFAMAKFPAIDRNLRAPLLEAYLKLDCYPDVPAALRGMKASGAKLALLSNGAPNMLQTAVASAGLDDVLDALFSIDSVRHFKAHPLAYTIFKDRWALAPNDIFFVSSNRWDIAGAAKAGFQTVWLNRHGLPDEYRDFPPSRIIHSLDELIEG
jgi:2-haloacid dehalogenase